MCEVLKKNYSQPNIKLQISIEVNVTGATNSKLVRKCRHSGPLNNTVKGNDNGMDKRIEKNIPLRIGIVLQKPLKEV